MTAPLLVSDPAPDALLADATLPHQELTRSKSGIVLTTDGDSHYWLEFSSAGQHYRTETITLGGPPETLAVWPTAEIGVFREEPDHSLEFVQAMPLTDEAVEMISYGWHDALERAQATFTAGVSSLALGGSIMFAAASTFNNMPAAVASGSIVCAGILLATLKYMTYRFELFQADRIDRANESYFMTLRRSNGGQGV